MKTLILFLPIIFVLGCKKSNDAPAKHKTTLTLTNDATTVAYVDSIYYNGYLITKTQIPPGGSFETDLEVSGREIDVYVSGGGRLNFIDISDGSGKIASDSFYPPGIKASATSKGGDITVNIYVKQL